MKNKILLAALLFNALLFSLGCGENDGPKPSDPDVAIGPAILNQATQLA